MNVYDSARMAECWRRSAMPRPTAPDEADMVILNTCHIREKAAEKVYSELGRLRALKAARAGRRRPHDHRRGRLRRPGRRRGDPAPRAACRYRARAADLSPPAGDGGARDARAPATGPAARLLDTDFPAESKFDFLPGAAAPQGRSAPSSPSRKAATSSAPSASCPIPAARNISRPVAADPGRGAPPGRAAARARSRCSARTSTPITAQRRTAARLGPRPADPRAGRDRRAWRASATPPRIRATWTTS